MINAELVKKLIDNALSENPSLFLVDMNISQDGEIKVWVDSDQSIDLEEIIRISRAIEHGEGMDREVEDFSLSVSTPGAESPLKMPRQYVKNIGRTLSVETKDGQKYEGEITAADDQKVTLQWSAREPKPIGKGKCTVIKTAELPYQEIKKARVVIKF
ncbi:MAG: ribosome assembly cofactor RimP [Flavobacteriales bacterium]|nr:ribosome assembly cofactor RimP [Flavobacteriales bacterium]